MTTNAESGLVGREVTITRVFDAPRDLVFAAWTESERMKEWWGPRGFTAPLCESDARPGGKLRIHMRGPDGTIYPMAGVYEEFVPVERVVCRSWAHDENEADAEFEILTTATFEDAGGKTKLTMNARVVKAGPGAEFAINGMEQGWSETLDRFGEFLATAK